MSGQQSAYQKGKAQADSRVRARIRSTSPYRISASSARAVHVAVPVEWLDLCAPTTA